MTWVTERRDTTFVCEPFEHYGSLEASRACSLSFTLSLSRLKLQVIFHKRATKKSRSLEIKTRLLGGITHVTSECLLRFVCVVTGILGKNFTTLRPIAYFLGITRALSHSHSHSLILFSLSLSLSLSSLSLNGACDCVTLDEPCHTYE